MNKLIFTASMAAILTLTGCKGESANTTQSSPAPKAKAEKVDTRAGKHKINVEAESKDGARLAAVLIYADWCSSCKILDPKVEAIKAGNDFPTTNFIKIDYTDKHLKTFIRGARKTNVVKALRDELQGKVKTGQMFLVDLDDQKVVAVIKKDMTEEEMIAAINEAASGA